MLDQERAVDRIATHNPYLIRSLMRRYRDIPADKLLPQDRRAKQSIEQWLTSTDFSQRRELLAFVRGEQMLAPKSPP